MIKVLLVVLNNVLNGTERYVVDLAKNLPKDEFDVYVATPVSGPLSKILADNNIKELVFDNDKVNYYSLKGLKNLYRIIRKNNFEIVHGNAKFHPCILAKLAGVQFTVETKHGIFYSKQQIENLPLWRKSYEYIKQFFVDKFIATSEFDMELMVKYFKIKKNKISVIYLGLDFDELKKRVPGIFTVPTQNKDKIVIGHIGRFTFQKAQEYLLEAFDMLASKYHNIELVLIGAGENENLLKDYVRKNNLESRIKFTGYVNDIYPAMSSFSMHVLTSRFEGTGYVNLEAMALGIPVVTSKVGGSNNFFTNEFDSMLTVPEDSGSTSAAIEKLVTNDHLRISIIQNAFNTVKKYPVSKMADDTAKFYSRHIKSKK